MGRKSHFASQVKKQRTTVTLPTESLREAHRIARTRRVNLSTVIAEALSEGLRQQTTAERSEGVLEGYKKAFAGFTDEEMAILDGVILESADGR